VVHKWNNFHLLGAALRNLLTEGKFHFSFPELTPFKEFIEVKGMAVRRGIANHIRSSKSALEIHQYRNLLIQHGIEQAMEL